MPDYTQEQLEFLEGVCQLVEALNPTFATLPMPPGTRPVGSPGGHWKTRQTKVMRFVPPGEILTQYGTDWFREVPEFYPPKVDIEVSMMRGKHDVTFAAFRVTRKGPRPKATVRYFRTDDLWLKGYYVVHSPSEHFPEHVSVYFGDPTVQNDIEDAVARWDRPGRVTLEQLAIPAGEAI